MTPYEDHNKTQDFQNQNKFVTQVTISQRQQTTLSARSVT